MALHRRRGDIAQALHEVVQLVRAHPILRLRDVLGERAVGALFVGVEGLVLLREIVKRIFRLELGAPILGVVHGARGHRVLEVERLHLVRLQDLELPVRRVLLHAVRPVPALASARGTMSTEPAAGCD